MLKQSNVNTILREPLLHFLLIGAGLFFIYSQINDSSLEEDNRYIHVTKEQQDKLSQNWIKSRGEAPSEDEQKKLVESFVLQEILFREAIERELDKDDTVIRRHLAKKMKYVFDDTSSIPDPTDKELESYLSKNSSKFEVPATISFNQIYFNPKLKSEKDKEATELLVQLKNALINKVLELGDESRIPYELNNISEKGIKNVFGDEFTKTIFNLPLETWVGPIESKQGLHLIYINKTTKAELPKLSEIKKDVSKEWHKDQREKANRNFYKSLLKQYNVVVDNNSKVK